MTRRVQMAGRNQRAMAERNALIEAELPSLQRYGRSLAANVDEGLDLVQETIIKALANWDSWTGQGPLRAWLFAIMRNHFYQTAQQRSRWRNILSDTPIEETTVATQPRQEHQVALRTMDAALARLPEEQREIVVLVSVEGLTYAETATVLSVPIGTVMSRLSRARARLRELLDSPSRSAAAGGAQ